MARVLEELAGFLISALQNDDETLISVLLRDH
jgi:hypothetical protein